MKKLLILTLALSLMATASFATYTRVLTMGDANMFVPDEHNIWLFPSTIVDYPELVLAEYWNANLYDEDYYYYYTKASEGPGFMPGMGFHYSWDGFTNMGVHLNFGNETPFIVGLYFTELEYTPEEFIQVDPYWDFDFDDLELFEDYGILPNKRVDAFVGTYLGENKFGAHLQLVSSSQAEEPGDAKEGLMVLGLDLGLTMMENKMDIAAGFKMLSFTDKDSDGDEEIKNDGSMGFHLDGRYFNERSEKITLVPHANLAYNKLGLKSGEEESDGKLSITQMMFAAGVGMHYKPATGILAVGDFGIIYNSEKAKEEGGGDSMEDKISDFNLPYFKAGLEAVVFDWLDLRMGGTSYWHMWTYTADAEEGEEEGKYKQNYVDTEFYLGAGFHWGNLYLDTYTNPQLLTDGFNFISGQQSNMNWMVSMKYKMF
ncbi:MAG: hypothetical protein JW763_00085 [candidate division Zixibacteria bacterium]|nr:hypothetical protein [candidate division Zixibacteria bacterium]